MSSEPLEQLCTVHGPGCRACNARREFVASEYLRDAQKWQPADVPCKGKCGEKENTEGCNSCGFRFCTQCIGNKRMFFPKSGSDALRVCGDCHTTRMNENNNTKYAFVYDSGAFPSFTPCVSQITKCLIYNPGIAVSKQAVLYSCPCGIMLSPVKCTGGGCKPKEEPCPDDKIQLIDCKNGARLWTYPSENDENTSLKLLNIIFGDPFLIPEETGTMQKLEGVLKLMDAGDKVTDVFDKKYCPYCKKHKEMPHSSSACSACLNHLGCATAKITITRGKESNLPQILALCMETIVRAFLKDHQIQSIFTHETTGYYVCGNCCSLLTSKEGMNCPQCHAHLVSQSTSAKFDHVKKGLEYVQPVVSKVAPAVAWGAEKVSSVGTAMSQVNQISSISQKVPSFSATGTVKEVCPGLVEMSMANRHYNTKTRLHDLGPVDEGTMAQIISNLTEVANKHHKGYQFIQRGHADSCKGNCRGSCVTKSTSNLYDYSDWDNIKTTPAPKRSLDGTANFIKKLDNGKTINQHAGKLLLTDDRGMLDMKAKRFILGDVIKLEYEILYLNTKETSSSRVTETMVVTEKEKDFLRRSIVEGIIETEE